MSPFTHPRIPTYRAVYDLHAVCSHYGYMNFGHYIAYCKPYSEEELDTLGLTSTDGKSPDFAGVAIFTATFQIIKLNMQIHFFSLMKYLCARNTFLPILF